MKKYIIFYFLILSPCISLSQIDTVYFTSEKVGLQILTLNIDTVKIYEEAKEYPKPFGPSLVNFSPKIFNYENSPLKIIFHDENMNILAILKWKNIIPGAYRFDWWEIIKTRPLGPYYLKVSTNKKSETKKVLLY